LDDDTQSLIESLVNEPNSSYQKNNGGFDIIIGNPPYVKVSDKKQTEYFDRKYKHQDYQYDLYLLFLEQYSNLLAEGGQLGVIIPNTWLQSIKYRNIRKYLVSKYLWERVLHFSSHVFNAVVDTHVLVFQKNQSIKNDSVCIDIFADNQVKEHQIINQYTLPDDGDVINIVATPDEKELYEKIKKRSNFIKDVCFSTVGVKPFQVGKGNPKQTREIVESKPFVVEKDGKPAGKDWYPLLRGSLMNRFVCYWNENSWVKYGEWLAEPRKKEIFDAEEKIIVRQTGDSIIATIIGKDIICRNNLHILISNSTNHHFILGILNSKLVNFYYAQINPEKG